MKGITKLKIYLAMFVMILTVALAVPAAAAPQVPFKGAFNGNDAVNAPMITTSGMGVGTHLGEFSLIEETTLTSVAGGTGSAHWVAANGDTIDSTFGASADFSTASLGFITVTEIHTITGGTGRFTGAHGTFTLERTHIVAPSADGTHVVFGSFNGTITSPGAANAEDDGD